MENEATGHHKIFTGIDPVDDVTRHYVIVRIEYGYTHIFHFGRYGETKENDLNDRHSQKDQHRPPVTKNMEKLFSDKML